MSDHDVKIACPNCNSTDAKFEFGGERGEAGPFVHCPDCDYDEEDNTRLNKIIALTTVLAEPKGKGAH